MAPAPASASAGAEPSALATSQSTGGGLGPVAAAPMRLQDDATVGEALAGYTAYLGGSFDPGHYGHVAGGVALLRHGADALWLAPTHVHADKCNSCPFDLRLAQCRAVADEIDSRLPQRLRGRVHVTDVEARVDSGGQTSRLFAHLTAAHPRRKFAFAMGSDCLAQAPGWDGWDALQRLVRVVVLDRPGYAADHRDLLGDPMPEVSSTAIRRALGAGVRPSALGDLMPPGVAALVDSCNLYGAMQRAGVPADAASTEAKRSHLHGEKSNVDAGPTPSASVASAPAGAPGAAPARAPAQASDRVASKPATPEAAVAAAPPGSGRVGGRIL